MYKYNEQPEGLRLPAKFGLEGAAEAEVRTQVWNYLLLGDADMQWLEELLADITDLDDDQIWDLSWYLVQKRQSQQARWAEADTTTNLDRAFAELEELNVLGLQDFACCGTCAADEMPAEFDDSRNWIGGVYFHRQDTEWLIESDQVYLGYGARVPAWTSKQDWDALDNEDKQAAFEGWSVDMMKQVVIPVLLRNGIDVDWDESFTSRPRLTNAHFYRRLTVA